MDGDVFNVSDGHPTTMTHYFNAVADLLGYPRPRQVSWDEARQVMSPLMLSYMAESRRMDNSRMLARLGIRLLYPDLASGLKACTGTRTNRRSTARPAHLLAPVHPLETALYFRQIDYALCRATCSTPGNRSCACEATRGARHTGIGS